MDSPNDPSAMGGPPIPQSETAVAPPPAAAPGMMGPEGSTEELLKQLVQKLDNLGSLMGGAGMSGQPVQKSPCNKVKEEDKTMTKADETPAVVQGEIKKADDLIQKATEAMSKATDLITKAETRLQAVEQENTLIKGRLDAMETLMKSTAQPPKVLVLDPAAAKAVPGMIQKSSGSLNVRNFDDLFSRGENK